MSWIISQAVKHIDAKSVCSAIDAVPAVILPDAITAPSAGDVKSPLYFNLSEAIKQDFIPGLRE